MIFLNRIEMFFSYIYPVFAVPEVQSKAFVFLYTPGAIFGKLKNFLAASGFVWTSPFRNGRSIPKDEVHDCLRPKEHKKEKGQKPFCE